MKQKIYFGYDLKMSNKVLLLLELENNNVVCQ